MRKDVRSVCCDGATERGAGGCWSSDWGTPSSATTLQDAIALGREVGIELPEAIEIVGLVTRRVFDVSEDLSEPVARAVPRAAALVLAMLGRETDG